MKSTLTGRITSEGAFTASGNVCEKTQQSNSSSLDLVMGEPLLGKPRIRLDAHQCLSTIGARCRRIVNTVFSAVGGREGVRGVRDGHRRGVRGSVV